MPKIKKKKSGTHAAGSFMKLKECYNFNWKSILKVLHKVKTFLDISYPLL